MAEKSVYQQACDDIRLNLWVLSPDARQQIIGWFNRIDQDAFDRGVLKEREEARDTRRAVEKDLNKPERWWQGNG